MTKLPYNGLKFPHKKKTEMFKTSEKLKVLPWFFLIEPFSFLRKVGFFHFVVFWRVPWSFDTVGTCEPLWLQSGWHTLWLFPTLGITWIIVMRWGKVHFYWLPHSKSWFINAHISRRKNITVDTLADEVVMTHKSKFVNFKILQT